MKNKKVNLINNIKNKLNKQELNFFEEFLGYEKTPDSNHADQVQQLTKGIEFIIR